MNAAIGSPTSSTGSDSWKSAVASAALDAKNPAMNSSESPGRKKPTSNPVSANTIASTPSVPKVSMSALGSRTLRAASSTPRRLPGFPDAGGATVRERMVVIGADAAGMSAASQARRRRGPDDLEIVAFERGRFTSYSACGIPYWISGDVPDRDALVARTPEELRTEYAVDVRIRTEVEAVDLDRREVVARERETGRELRCGFDVLVVATGAVPVRPALPGVDAAGVFGVQTLDDGVAVREALDVGARRAVVVGGGYIGVEMAEALVKRGLRVPLVERAAEPMSTLDPDMGRLVREAMIGMGIDVRSGETLQGFATADGRVRAVVTDRGEVVADLVVLGIGVRPNTALAAAAGLPLGPTGGLRTDRRMRVTGVEGVWAAGDCVETYDLVARQPVHVPLGTHANKQGRVIGINVGGGYATFPGIVRTAVSKVCEL